MAFLRKFINRNTYMLIVGIANAITVAISSIASFHPVETGLAITVVNLVVAWLGVETQTSVTAESQDVDTY